MDQKPLTKQRREAIKETRDEYAAEGRSLAKDYDDLLASEAYWREAVKNAKPDIYFEYGEPYDICPFCRAKAAYWKDSSIGEHQPDCPWLLAQSYPE